MLRVITFLFLFLTTVIAGAEKTTLRKVWTEGHYVAKTVPAAWLPGKVPAPVTDVAEFDQFSLQTEGLSIPKFIARYGLPSRYLGTERADRQDFLIYDLPSGHAVALYVPKPPVATFAACVIITADGSLVQLIK